MAAPRKKKNGRWTVQVYVGTDKDGKRIYKRVTADTKVECQYRAAQIRQEGVPETPDAMSVRDAVERYISSIENVISPNTLRGYETILNNYFQDLMGMDVNDVDNITMQEAINRESLRISYKSKKPVSPKTIANGYGLISTAMKKVCGKVYDVKLPQQIVRIKEFPELPEIIEAVRGTKSELPVLLAAWLGMRMGEIKGLDCSSIRNGVLHIEQTRVYKDGHEVVKPTAKNDTSIRNIPVRPYLVRLMESTEEYKKYRETGEDGPLITTPRNRIYKRWKKIAKDHGWNMSFHDLRAVNVSIALVLGIPEKYTMQRDGFKTNSTLRKRYQQFFPESRKEADRKIDEYFEQFLL